MTNTQPRFILASGSPRRRDLLGSLGITFTVIKSDVDESQQPDEDSISYVKRLSREKAEAVATQIESPAFILAADTTVILDREILGKPVDAAEARRMLIRLRGRAHTVCTGMTLLRLDEDESRYEDTQYTCTTVVMREYTDAEMNEYIQSGDPFDKAGSYAIQHEGFAPVERVDGSYTNVMGLPLETLRDMLIEAGYPIRLRIAP